MQTTPGSHEGLGLDYYAWCTSPLRRYSDLVNQWQLIALAKHGVTAKMVAPFPPRDATLMGIAADFESCYQAYGEVQDRLEKYWCLRWMMQDSDFKTVHVRHVKEGMSRVESVPLHLPIPELASYPRLTRAEVVIADIDLLQLSAGVRVLEIEAKPESPEQALTDPVEESQPANNPKEDAGPNKSFEFPCSRGLSEALQFIRSTWNRYPFRFALCASILIHIIFLSFRWGIGEMQNRRLNTPLSVVSVNASNKIPPQKASKLAQADLQGGGKTDSQDATALHRARLGAEARLEVLERAAKADARQARGTTYSSWWSKEW